MKFKRWNRSTIPWLFLLLFLCACVSASPKIKAGQQPDPTANTTISQKSEVTPDNQLVFITMSITQEEDGRRRVIKVQEVVKSPATAKVPPKGLPFRGPYLSCILYAGPKRLDSIQVEHPLFQYREFVNDQQQFSRKAVQLNQAEFFIRFQQGAANQVKIEERMPGAAPQELIIIKL